MSNRPSLDQIFNDGLQRKYQHALKTRQEAMVAIKHYPCLSPKKESFVFNDGSEKEFLNLDGTIPVRYKGSTYNIPICIWLLDNHPLSAPMVYVKPTVEMLIKPSRHVDQNGKVYLPYLHEWNSNSSDLLGLIQIMIMTFAEMPPVYAKPKNCSPSQFPTPYPTQPSGFMPVPGGGGGGGGTSMPVAYPPMPPTSAGGPNFSPYHNPQMQSSQTPYPVYPPTSQAPYAGGMPPPPYPPGVGNPPYPSYGTNPPNSISSLNSDSSGSVRPGTGTITEEHIRASLISAASHKVRERLRDAYGTSQAEVSALRQQQSDLSNGKTKLEGLLKKLTMEQNELDKSIRHLQEKELEMKNVLDKVIEETEPLDIDEAVTTTAPLYKQLLTAYAEDQATQDAIYYLGEALRRDVIDLDTYLKHVRSLSRRQFQLRATMNKCRIKANLAA
ncbi:Tumor susceptibility protein [Armadillidium nasatum]|uniref:Tumor susceptibility protein n=1 Tax=Armadillidium nasatum TaxID=96803 RepID=A0A5N5TGQ3_9CRUS|nr:Tumor susceptibility protein [Armadillidium nasatum]